MRGYIPSYSPIHGLLQIILQQALSLSQIILMNSVLRHANLLNFHVSAGLEFRCVRGQARAPSRYLWALLPAQLPAGDLLDFAA
jgi:hypothetical protein